MLDILLKNCWRDNPVHYCAYQLASNSENEAKALLRGHCPLCATRRFIGALVHVASSDHVWYGPSKPSSPPPSWGSALPATKQR